MLQPRAMSLRGPTGRGNLLLQLIDFLVPKEYRAVYADSSFSWRYIRKDYREIATARWASQ